MSTTMKRTQFTRALSKKLRDDDRGVALPMVLLVFMLSFILIGAFSIMLTGSAQVTSLAKGSVQSQAAADAGIAAAKVAVTTVSDAGTNFCTSPPPVTGTDPDYSVQLTCDNDANPTTLTIVSTGTAEDGSQTVLQAIMPVTAGTTQTVVQKQRSLAIGSGSIGTLQPVSGDPNVKFTLVQPGDDYSCSSWNAKTITGDLFVLNGNVTLETSGCQVLGNVWASGYVNVQGGVVGGDVKAASTAKSGAVGGANIGGSFTARGAINTSWGSNTIAGGLFPNTPVSLPANLPNSTWLEYAFDAAQWQAQGYVQGTVNGCGANDNLLTKVNAATVPTYFICPGALNMWNQFTFSPKTDIAIVSPGGSLARFTVQSGNAQTHLLSLITNDGNVNSNSPTCTRPARTLNMSGGVDVKSSMRMSIYTPCQVSLGPTTTIRGAVVAGSVNSWSAGNQLITYDVEIPGYSLAVDDDGVFVTGTGGVPKLTDGLSTQPTELRTVG